MTTQAYEINSLRPTEAAKRHRVAGGISELHLRPFVHLHSHNLATGEPSTRLGHVANLAAAGVFYKVFGPSVPNPFTSQIERSE